MSALAEALPMAKSKGRPKNPYGEGTAVRLDSGLVSKARYICAEKNISMTEYISEMIRARIERDFASSKPSPPTETED